MSRFYGYLVDFSRIGMLFQEKSVNPADHEIGQGQRLLFVVSFLYIYFEHSVLEQIQP
jgi:hypothetical protein